MEDSKVFVTQVPSRLEDGQWVPTVDITPARKFGEIEVLFPAGFFYTDRSSFQRLKERLHAFQSDNDFLLPMGDPVLMSAAAAILGSRHEAFSVLKWDRKTSEYYHYTIPYEQR